MCEENKTFQEEDVFKLISIIPQSWYRSEDSFKYFLNETVNLGEELNNILDLYPRVLCEPLDNHYILLRALGSIHEDLIFDLCTFYPKYGIALSSFLICLAPNESYKKLLISSKEKLINKNHSWLIDLAISEINGVSWQSFPEISVLLYKLRNSLKKLDVPHIKMKKMWTHQQLEDFAEKQLIVKHIYKEKGADAALAKIKELKLKD